MFTDSKDTHRSVVFMMFLRLFRKYVFGEADEIELKFVNR
jgi:hypothetical protein